MKAYDILISECALKHFFYKYACVATVTQAFPSQSLMVVFTKML